ncbi:ABC transporter permease [Terrimonas sp. NA20]|uniref:ABC transporter permease n=1 Tax=Terrimonas ginsenosidimutans TaxID=2908004 RepID=A0ABS9KXV2_9BACT|nr:ABC transporter permease [Terrimonas ginsenosidimutans]MCG2617156.1 ABC transporter permease [Terrimonas ginsenosidimutans]
MIKTYFKIAFRNLWKNKTFTFINLAGLTVGLTCVILMVLYIQHELSYDKFQKNADRIARVTMEYSMSGGEPRKIVMTSTKVLPALKRVFPEIEDGVRMSGGRSGLVKYEDKVFIEPGFIHADSTFFSVFSSFKLLKGTADQVLKAPNMLVISESAGKKLFGNDDPVGKTLQVGAAQTNYLITGVAEDCPSNSQIKFNFLASFSSLGPAQETTYFNANFITYFLLKDKASIASLQPKIAPFMKKDMTDAAMTFHLEPYTSVHLHSGLDGFEPNSNINYIYITGGVALLILIIACFTYVNLSTARSMERAKEVGIRKVSGAFRSQVFWQFIGESSLLTGIALILSFVLAGLLLPSFNELAERSLSLSGLLKPSILIIALLILTSISLLAGSYPALILSRFQPVKVLKGTFRNSSSGTWIRKSLTVFQFTVSAFLIIATFVLQRQLKYIQTKKLGYDREHIVVLPMDSRINEKTELFKTALKKDPEVLAVSKSYNTPVNIMGGYSMSNSLSNENAMSVKANPIDEDYIKVNNLKIIAGTDLSRQDLLDVNTSDTTRKPYFHYVLNESAAAALGWKPEEAIGKRMFLGDQRPGEVKAVIKDFHFASLHTAVEPLVLFPDNWGSVMQVKMTGNNMSQTIAHLEKTWKELAPHRPFMYTFMDEDYNKMYASEMRTGDVFKVFATIAILLACMGLFGLSAYSVQQRTKEIGIRKVLGASSARITVSLVNQFVKLVFISFLIAVPVAWMLSEKWLSSFVYRTDIPVYIFLVAGLSITFVAMFTVGTQALRAALSNPVKSLRTE